MLEKWRQWSCDNRIDEYYIGEKSIWGRNEGKKLKTFLFISEENKGDFWRKESVIKKKK